MSGRGKLTLIKMLLKIC